MAILGFLAGMWFLVMGWYAAAHADRSPETPVGHWLSFPSGRRVGGVLSVLVGLSVMVGSVTWL